MIEMWEVGKWFNDWDINVRKISVLKVTKHKIYYGESLEDGFYEVLYKDSDSYRIVETFDEAKRLAIKWQKKKVKEISKQKKEAVKELERFEALIKEDVQVII